MKKNISRNPLWPDWYNGKKIDEVQFGRAFLEQWPLKCVNGTLYITIAGIHSFAHQITCTCIVIATLFFTTTSAISEIYYIIAFCSIKPF